jgi:hypothetical protein
MSFNKVLRPFKKNECKNNFSKHEVLDFVPKTVIAESRGKNIVHNYNKFANVPLKEELQKNTIIENLEKAFETETQKRISAEEKTLFFLTNFLSKKSFKKHKKTCRSL